MNMKVVTDIKRCREAIETLRERGTRVGLVPTMGALHEGHLFLVEESRRQCGATVVTIFVNPTQFAPTEDLAQYPRPLEADLQLCRDAGVDLVFTPTVAEMYGNDVCMTIEASGLTDHLCGAIRPGHFSGVATVVAKLFHIAPAHVAFFGEKDFQQLQVVRRMVRDLNFPIEIAGCPTVRESDGLAVSSRNAYLSEAERVQAPVLFRAMSEAAESIAGGHRNVAALVATMRQTITAAGPMDIEYIEIIDVERLEPVATVDGPSRICLAIRMGRCRLIDNLGVDAVERSG